MLNAAREQTTTLCNGYEHFETRRGKHASRTSAIRTTGWMERDENALNGSAFRLEQAAISTNAFSATKAKTSSDPAVAEKQKKLANIFAPPTNIMFMGDFQAARQVSASYPRCFFLFFLVNFNWRRQKEEDGVLHLGVQIDKPRSMFFFYLSSLPLMDTRGGGGAFLQMCFCTPYSL